MSVYQFGTQTMAFTMSRSNFNNRMQEFQEEEDCLPEFSTNIRCCCEISFQASFTHAGRSNLFSSVFTWSRIDNRKFSGFQKAFCKLWNLICGCFSPPQPISKIICINSILKILSNYWIVFHLRNQLPRLLGLVKLHLRLQLLRKCTCGFGSHCRIFCCDFMTTLKSHALINCCLFR